MSISPVGDIVLEVARAADPTAYRAATARLRVLADPAPSATFEAIAGSAAPRGAPPPPHLPFDAARALVHLRSADAVATPRGDPYERFEAFVLQTFVQSMLPKGDSALFGSGTAGEIWKSMLARGIGVELARSGGIGIAATLADARDDIEGRPAASAAIARESEAGA